MRFLKNQGNNLTPFLIKPLVVLDDINKKRSALNNIP
jgi:hypothetical protein